MQPLSACLCRDGYLCCDPEHDMSITTNRSIARRLVWLRCWCRELMLSYAEE